MAINNSSFLSDSVLAIRSVLASGLSDPVSTVRPSGSHFVNTSYPDRVVYYPLVCIQKKNMSSYRVGAYNDQTAIIDPLQFQIDVFSKNTKERDQLTGSVFNVLNSTQYSTGSPAASGTVNLGLYDFKLLTSFPLTEGEGEKDRLHREVMVIQYKMVVSV